MAWIRVDDSFDDHPKMMEAGPLGWALWLAGLAYANRNLTDGFIPWSAARKLVSWDFLGPSDGDERGRKVYTVAVTCGMAGDDVSSDFVIHLLLECGLWEEIDGGYYIHDYPEYQPLKADVEKKREQTRERVAKWRGKQDTIKEGNSVSNGICNSVTNADVTPAPNPNPKLNTEEGTAPNGTEPDSDENPQFTHAERAIATCVREIRGMANVPPAEIILHIRECLDIRGSPLAELTMRREFQKFRDYHGPRRLNQPKNAKWRGWKNAVTNWITRIPDEPEHDTMSLLDAHYPEWQMADDE